MKKLLAVFFCLICVAGCASEPPTAVQYMAPSVNKIVLKVAKIDIIDHSEFQPSDSPYYASRLEPTIAQEVRKWITNNVQAEGINGQAIILIQDASLSSRALATSDSMIDTMFKRQQASQFSGHVKVQLEIRGLNDNYGFADAEASRKVSIPETPTGSEKQNAYFTLLNGLMEDFSQNFRSSLHQHLQDLILR